MYIYIYMFIYIYIYVYIYIYTYLYICSAHFASGNWTIGLPFLVPLLFEKIVLLSGKIFS